MGAYQGVCDIRFSENFAYGGIHKVCTQVRGKGESDQELSSTVLVTLKCTQGGEGPNI